MINIGSGPSWEQWGRFQPLKILRCAPIAGQPVRLRPAAMTALRVAGGLSSSAPSIPIIAAWAW